MSTVFCPHCQMSEESWLTRLSKNPLRVRCDTCKAIFEICSNCDVPGLVPEGKTSDDCVVCDGTTLVKVN